MTHRLKASETVLVVVDMQERLLPAIHENGRVVAKTRLLLRAASALGLPVVMTTQYAKGLGSTEKSLAELAPRSVPIDKQTFSSFDSPEFKHALTATARRSLILSGVEAHICVLQTGLDALAAGYQVHVATDATGSRAPENAVLGQRRLELAGAILSSTEMAIYELLGSSGTPTFKALLPHLK